MKQIRAYIQPYMLARVYLALLEIPEFPGISVSDCVGFGREKVKSGQDYTPFLQKKRLEIFCVDEQVDIIVETIIKEAHTGNHGDGKVFVTEVVEGARISTGERGREVV
jgi:nitrogen regulatory protein P-II 1